LNLRPKIRNAEVRYFLGFDQRNDRRSVPCGNCVEVRREITRPVAANCVGIMLAWCKSDADLTEPRARVNRINPQRVRFARSDHALPPIIQSSPPLSPRP
jgi:hypothetical protein